MIKTLFKVQRKGNRNIVKEFIRVYMMVLVCGAVASALTGCALVINSENVKMSVTQEHLLTNDTESLTSSIEGLITGEDSE